MLDFAKSPSSYISYLAGHHITRSGDVEQCGFILVLVWPPGPYDRCPGAKPEQQINVVGLSCMSWGESENFLNDLRR